MFSSTKYIFWDLDGTLTDSGLGIIHSVQYALRRFGIEENDMDALRPFIGPPLYESFERFYGFSKEQAVRAVEVYREYFADKGLFENEVYPGIPDLLADLKAKGKTLALATSKPELYTLRILEHFHLDGYFSAVVGSTMDGSLIRKADVLAACMNKIGCSAQEAVMIGDRRFDVEGAAALGVQTIGVAYGYGSREELEQAGAMAIADSVAQLRTILLP